MIATPPHAAVLRSNELTIHTASKPLEMSQLRAVLNEQHYLKAGRRAGHVLWQGAWEYDPEIGLERLVAVFCWAGAAKRLKDRDEWIGWDAVTCATCRARCALPNNTLRSLRDALRQVDDLRNSKSRRHPISAMLTLICYGLLCGAADVKAIWKKCGGTNLHGDGSNHLIRID